MLSLFHVNYEVLRTTQGKKPDASCLESGAMRTDDIGMAVVKTAESVRPVLGRIMVEQ